MTETACLLLGAIIGAGFIYYFIFREKIQSSEKKIEQLQKQLADEKEKKINYEATLNAVKSTHGEMMNRIRDTFDATASKAMQNQMEIFGNMADRLIGQHTEKANEHFNLKKEAIDQMLKPLNDSLNRNELIIKDLQTGSSRIFGHLTACIDELNKRQVDLARETHLLTTALKAPKIRGRWGEIGLRRIVEYAGLNDYCDFDEQPSIPSPDGLLRPDLIVNLPDNRKVIVDAKVPLNAYLEMIETDDEGIRRDCMQKHAGAVLQHLRNLSGKNYKARFGETIDFTVLYMEIEPSFGAALAYNKDLIGEALEHRIVFATPSTLIVLLQTVAYAWKQHSAAENAAQILKTTKELQNRLAVFEEYYRKVGSQIQNLVKTFNLSAGSWESRVQPGIRRVAELENSKLDDSRTIDPVELSVRTPNESI